MTIKTKLRHCLSGICLTRIQRLNKHDQDLFVLICGLQGSLDLSCILWCPFFKVSDKLVSSTQSISQRAEFLTRNARCHIPSSLLNVVYYCLAIAVPDFLSEIYMMMKDAHHRQILFCSTSKLFNINIILNQIFTQQHFKITSSSIVLVFKQTRFSDLDGKMPGKGFKVAHS